MHQIYGKFIFHQIHDFFLCRTFVVFNNIFYRAAFFVSISYELLVLAPKKTLIRAEEKVSRKVVCFLFAPAVYAPRSVCCPLNWESRERQDEREAGDRIFLGKINNTYNRLQEADTSFVLSGIFSYSSLQLRVWILRSVCARKDLSDIKSRRLSPGKQPGKNWGRWSPEG